MTRPLLALDVDGALSPVRRPHGVVERTWHDIEAVPHSPGPLHLSLSLGLELAALDVDIVWVTTWGDLANHHVAPALGWDPLPVLVDPNPHPPAAAGREVWKARAVDAYVVEHEPPALVWIDDLLGVERSALRMTVDRWLEQGWPGIPSLLVGPDRHAGLSPDDLGQIRDFLA